MLALHASPCDGNDTVSDRPETGASGASGDGSESCDDCDTVSDDLETGCDEPCDGGGTVSDDAEDTSDKGGADNA